MLKDKTSKSAFSKKMASLVEDKRIAEERLWESYRESEAREKLLRKNLVKCQRDLVAIETQNELLKRSLREEQKAKQLLQKAITSQANENKVNIEMASLRKVENFTRFEFERILEENTKLQIEIADLRQQVVKLQRAMQSQVSICEINENFQEI
jgi:predicted  nucleic acid-binding Zn-ribbon protein